MLRWRRTPNGLGWVSSPVSTPWVRDIIYELYPADERTWGRHRWQITKSDNYGPRRSQGVRGPLAVAKELCVSDLVEEKNWLAKAMEIQKLLFDRTGRKWDMRQGKGTSANNIYVSSPPDRKQDRFGTQMSREDRVLLAEAFKIPVGLITDMVIIQPDQYAGYLTKLRE